jgi:hypothetical protein
MEPTLLNATETAVEAAAAALVRMRPLQLAALHRLLDKGLQVAAERESRDMAAAAQVKPAKQTVAVMEVMENLVPLLEQAWIAAVEAVAEAETTFLYRRLTAALVAEEEVEEIVPAKLEGLELISSAAAVVVAEVEAVHS